MRFHLIRSFGLANKSSLDRPLGQADCSYLLAYSEENNGMESGQNTYYEHKVAYHMSIYVNILILLSHLIGFCSENVQRHFI